MTIQSCNKFLRGTAALAMIAGFALAANHHELNGTWQLVPTRSELHGEAMIQTGTVTINDRQGNVYVSRNFNFDGPNQSTSTSFSTDSREKASIKEPGFKSKAKWDGDVLKVMTTQEGMTMVERYSMKEDGELMLQLERAGHQPETLYFQRQ